MNLTRRKPKTGRTLCAALLLLAGCAGPEARIRRQQAQFAQLAPEAQAMIRDGRVGLGFSPEMVRLAVGEPDRRWTRTDAQGETEIWSYTSFETRRDGRLERGWYPAGAAGSPWALEASGGTARAREYFKVSFTGGRVSAVEQFER